jgi:hypothetical protein
VVKEKGKEERNKASVSVACEMEQYVGSHWLCDQSSEEECKHNVHRKGLIQKTVGIRT